MTRHDASRLADILEAIDAIGDHLTKGDLNDGLVYDAVRVRLIEIGEAVKAISPQLLEAQSEIPWKAIARMRDHLAHRYFDTDHAVVHDVVGQRARPAPRRGPCARGAPRRRRLSWHSDWHSTRRNEVGFGDIGRMRYRP